MKGKATRDSFNRCYEDKLSSSENYKQAYEQAEKQHIKEFGGRKYSSYTSFRVNRSRKK